jgi:hypothetical protein
MTAHALWVIAAAAASCSIEQRILLRFKQATCLMQLV